MHLEDLNRHNRKVFDSWHMVDAELNPYDDVGVRSQSLVPLSPSSHPCTPARLIGIPTASVKLTVTVSRDIDVVVGKFCSLVVIAFRVAHELLERRSHDLVGNRLAVDWVERVGVGDLESSVGVDIKVQASRLLNCHFNDPIANAMRVPVGISRHSMSLLIDELVGVAIDHGVYSEREDVLVVAGKNAWVDDSTKRYSNLVQIVVDRLSRQDTGSSYFICNLTSLVEEEHQDVLIIRDSNDGLKHQFSRPDDCSTASTVVGVLPTDAGILLVNADTVFLRLRPTLIIGDDSAEILNASEAIAAKLKIIGCSAGSSITQVKGSFLEEGMTRVCIRNIHVRERQSIEEWPAIVFDVIKDHAFTLVEAWSRCQLPRRVLEPKASAHR